MNSHSEDILQPIPYEKLPELRDLFKSDWPSTVHVYYFIDTCIKVKRKRPTENYVTFYCPNGNFDDGTFVAIIEMYCYYIFIFTLDKTLHRLRTALRNTRIIDWKQKPHFSAVKINFFKMFTEVRNEIRHPIMNDIPNHVWWLPRDKALSFTYDVPPELYVSPLNETHIELMNSVYPHKGPESDKYLGKIVELNGGIGLFRKSNDELCCWIMKHYFGGLGVLQTAESHKRKGYGSLIVKIFSKMIAEKDGYDISVFIINENIASQKLFSALGFEKVMSITWCN